jgi:hypothetical protein
VNAAAEATARRAEQALALIGGLATETDPDVLCAAGELALLVRHHGLANALFAQILQKQAKHGCATLGIASAAMMQNNLDLASKMLWAAIDVAPREQRAALGAAVKDLQQIAGTK